MKLKYDVGDEVYFINESQICKGKIKEVNYNNVLKNVKKFRKINGLKNYGRNT